MIRLGQADISLFSFLFLLLMTSSVQAQENSSFVDSSYQVLSDTLLLHEHVVLSTSITLTHDGQPSNYTFLHELNGQNKILLSDSSLIGKSVRVQYRVFPFKGTEYFVLKDSAYIRSDFEEESPFAYKPGGRDESLFDFGRLDKRGSISRGILVGSAQDLSVNSDLNLQLTGKLTENISLIANISDDNVPIQTDGNTQQLQEFDQVYIKIYDSKNALTAGDFQLRNTDKYFLTYQKKARGASFLHENIKQASTDSTREELMRIHGSAAVSRGKFSRNVIQGIEGNQGPYRLAGADNEQFIIILSGTERIYIDGQLLKRGKEFDYVIDYNSADLTFTAKRLITKDRRIVAEFQYSERNYARSLLTAGVDYSNQKVVAFVDVFSEQDSKKQSLQQELTPEDRLFLSNVGDNLAAALTPRIDSVGFSEDAVLYALTDSLGYDSVYVQSSNPDEAFYELSFTQVGQGNGFYVQDDFLSNGRVFRWAAPDTIGGQLVLNGDYAPVLLLVTPKSRRMMSSGVKYRPDDKTLLSVEGAISEFDSNTFSTQDADDDFGHAFNIGLGRNFTLRDTSGGKAGLELAAKVDYEQTAEHFQFVERYRPVEYERNWNLLSTAQLGLQQLTGASIGVRKDGRTYVTFRAEMLDIGNQYRGYRNGVDASYKDEKWTFKLVGSQLSTASDESTDFIRHRGLVSRKFGPLVVGFKDEHERNRFQSPDTLSALSYEFFDWEAFVSSGDSGAVKYEVSFRNREDFRPENNDLQAAARAQEWGVKLGTRKIKNQRIDITATYRTLEIIRSSLITQTPEDNFLGRIEYNGRFFKNGLTIGSFYDVGSGLERKRQFVFLEVAPGQGTYVWIDYNEDGVRDLDEFEIAQFTYEANFIRTFTPTDEFEKTFSNQFGQTLGLEPARWWRNEKGLKGFIGKFSDQAVWRSDRKTIKDENISIFDPFETNLQDSTLLSSNTSIRNTVYFNKTHPVWSIDHTIQESGNKQLLTNGFDTRNLNEQSVNFRLTVKKVWTLKVKNRWSTKLNRSDFSTNRDYTISLVGLEPTLAYQPNRKYRVTVRGERTEKDNILSEAETAEITRVGAEFRYSFVQKGNIQIDIDLYDITYDGADNTSLAFEMLNGLKPGQNYTWGARLQRNLSENLELNFTYNGRLSEDVQTIHTGGVQVRAFF